MKAVATLVLRANFAAVHVRRRFSDRRGPSGDENLRKLLLSMSTGEGVKQKVRKNLKAKKEASMRYSAGVIQLQVLGNGAPGHPSSLFVFTDQTRYMFNCGEGTQRLAHEHKVKLSKLEHIFVTNNTWENLGGLPGASLTVQDIGVPSIYLHGPPGIAELYEAMKRFVVLKDLDIHVVDATISPVHDDPVLKVFGITLYPSEESVEAKTEYPPKCSKFLENGEEKVDYYEQVRGCTSQVSIVEEKGPKRKCLDTNSLNETDTDQTPYTKKVVCYVCQPKKKEGMLLIERCVEAGVPAGPLLGKLKSGEDVVLPDGQTVKASEVKSPDCPGPIFLVIDCPSEQYLDSLIQNETLKSYQKAQIEIETVHLVVHFSPSAVMNTEKYAKWMENFPLSTKHLMMNDLNGGYCSEAVHRIQHKLHLIEPELFPLMDQQGAKETQKMMIKANVPCITPETMTKYVIRPTCELDCSSVVTLKPTEYKKEVMAVEGFPAEHVSLKEALAECNEGNSLLEKEYPEIVFMGTGSSIPNKTRNVSGILLNMSCEEAVILDCGEGTLGQIYRFYGQEEGLRVLCRVKAIFISHLHADHHLGLINLLKHRKKALDELGEKGEPVVLIAPHQISSWLQVYETWFESIEDTYVLFPCVYWLEKKPEMTNKIPLPCDKVLDSMKMDKIETVNVVHCKHSFGVALSHKEGWKVTYSGDTMPSEGLVRIGADSDVLIHEATLEDELKEEAVVKQHSTTSEAIEIGRQMRAKFTILTHFSQRYAKVPVFNESFYNNVGIAFDNMIVRPNQLKKFSLLYPAMKVMFSAEVDDLELKRIKKVRQKEKERLGLKLGAARPSTV